LSEDLMRVRVNWLAILFALIFVSGLGSSPVRARAPVASDKVILYLFWGNGCPHCAEERPFLVDLGQRYPQLEVRAYEVWYHADNMALFQKMGQAFGYDPKSVPGTYLGGQHWDGFDAAISQEIESAVQSCLQTGCKDAGAGIITGGTPDPWPNAPEGGPSSAVTAAIIVALTAAGLLILLLIGRRLLRRARL
jgi:thiol-disulfide isomerase/thioredoxin